MSCEETLKHPFATATLVRGWLIYRGLTPLCLSLDIICDWRMHINVKLLKTNLLVIESCKNVFLFFVCLKLESKTIVDVYLNYYAFFYFYIGFILPLCVGELFIA